MHTVGKWRAHTHTHTRMRNCHLCWVPLAGVHHSWAHPCNPCPHTHTPPRGLWRLHERNGWRFLTRQGPSRVGLLYMMRPLYTTAGLTAVTHKPSCSNRIPCSWSDHSNETPLLRGHTSPVCAFNYPGFQTTNKIIDMSRMWCSIIDKYVNFPMYCRVTFTLDLRHSGNTTTANCSDL